MVPAEEIPDVEGRRRNELATAREDVAHLLRRAGFGGTAGEIDALTGLDLPVIVDRLLDVSAAPAVVAPAELTTTPIDTYKQWVAMNSWWIERMRTTPAPLQEKMTLFWHGHFVSSLEIVELASVMFKQNQLFRSMGMGSFQTLTQPVSIDPGMLRYLDNYQNIAGRP